MNVPGDILRKESSIPVDKHTRASACSPLLSSLATHSPMSSTWWILACVAGNLLTSP